jgi:hypothetical protein
MTMKGNEAVKANFRNNSDMFKDNEKKNKMYVLS